MISCYEANNPGECLRSTVKGVKYTEGREWTISQLDGGCPVQWGSSSVEWEVSCSAGEGASTLCKY